MPPAHEDVHCREVSSTSDVLSREAKGASASLPRRAADFIRFQRALTRRSEQSRCVRQHSKISRIIHDRKVVRIRHTVLLRGSSRSVPDRWLQKAACRSRSSTPTTMAFGQGASRRCYSAKGASWASSKCYLRSWGDFSKF